MLLPSVRAPLNPNAGNCVRVYLECDYDLFRDKGFRAESTSNNNRAASTMPEMKVGLHPNPANDWLLATIESPVEQEAGLFLLDQLGRSRAMGTTPLSAGRNEIPIPAAELGQGVYYLSIQTKDTRQVERFLIQR